MKKNYAIRLTITFIIYSLLYSSDLFCQNYQWAKGIVTSGGGNSIATDAAGNVYVTGAFQNTSDFDPGPGTANLTSAGSNDIFFAKYDANGNYLWAKRIGSINNDNGGYGITVDASGNVYIVGDFRGTADFDPGPGTANLTPVGSGDVFFAKYDTNGNYIWAKNAGGGGFEEGFAIAHDAGGNVYITGAFQATVDFDPGPGTANLTSAASNEIFFAKYDGSGNYVWAKSIVSSGSDYGYSILTDATGNVYVGGAYSGTADFDPGPGTFTLSSVATNYDIFVGKYDAGGNYIWAKSMGGPSADFSRSIALDAAGNLYITGMFQSSADFDPGPGVVNLSASGNLDIFFGKYDVNGNYVWAKRIGMGSTDQGFGITVDAGGNTYLTGAFTGTVDFDPGPGTANLISSGADDIFFGKYDGAGNYLWAANAGGPGSDYSNSIAIDAMGNVHITGHFYGPADFDPGPGTAILPAGGQDIFIAKYSSCASAPSTPGIISGNTTLCSGSNNTYSVTNDPSATSYTWSLPGGWSGTSSTNTISATSGTSGVFSVTATNGCGTSAAQVLSVTVNQTPSSPGPISGSISICESSSQTYSVAPVSGATSYSWTLPGGFTGTSATNIISVTAGPNSGNVSVSASNSCGTSTLQVLSVQVNNPPGLPSAISGSTNLCSGVGSQTYSVTLASTSLTYSWTLPGGWTGSSTTNTILAAPGTSGTLSVLATYSCGTSPTQTLLVTIDPTPTIAVNSGAICSGTSFTIVPNGANTYTFSSGPVVSPTTTSSYSVTGTSTTGCVSSSAAISNVTVNSLPTISANTSNSIICGPPFQGTATLTASGASTYTWNTTATTTAIAVSPSVTTVYTVTGTDANGCTNSSSFTQSVSTCAGIDRISNSVSEIQVYPNPFNNKITVVSNSAKQPVLIYNALGSLIYKTEIENEKIEIDLSKESSGIYFIRIGTQIKKIIKE